MCKKIKWWYDFKFIRFKERNIWFNFWFRGSFLFLQKKVDTLNVEFYSIQQYEHRDGFVISGDIILHGIATEDFKDIVLKLLWHHLNMNSKKCFQSNILWLENLSTILPPGTDWKIWASSWSTCTPSWLGSSWTTPSSSSSRLGTTTSTGQSSSTSGFWKPSKLTSLSLLKFSSLSINISNYTTSLIILRYLLMKPIKLTHLTSESRFQC